jgi:hypothetical protein
MAKNLCNAAPPDVGVGVPPAALRKAQGVEVEPWAGILPALGVLPRLRLVSLSSSTGSRPGSEPASLC